MQYRANALVAEHGLRNALSGLHIDTLIAVGGFGAVISAWQAGLIDVDADQIVAHSSRLGATLAAQYFAENADMTLPAPIPESSPP